MQIQVNTNKIRTQYHKGGDELFCAAFIWSLRAQFEEKFNTPHYDKMENMGELYHQQENASSAPIATISKNLQIPKCSRNFF